MKKQSLLFLLFIVCATGFAQDQKKIMETRAREMIRVISLNNKEQWKKFIKENYTQALIDRNMKAKVSTSDTKGGDKSTDSNESNNNLEAKVQMFERLHQDFGGGEISSLTIKEDNLEMKVTVMELTGTFNLRFEKTKPYRIDGLGIEAGN